MEDVIQGAGYTRKFRDCFHVDANGNFSNKNVTDEDQSVTLTANYTVGDVTTTATKEILLEKRTLVELSIIGDGIIPSFSSFGYYGFQMCLESGWFKKRIDTIDEVLSKHAFSGVYYDWCSSKECLNSKHGKRHWDYNKLIELLEWSRKRVGKDGAVYLHQTRNPNILAENLATLILTEETGGSVIYPEMFSPHAHFMNIVPRQVCLMIPETAPENDLRRYAMCALLHHATVSSWHKVFLDFYREQAPLMRECVKYRRHTAPGEGMCGTSSDQVGMSVYWNEKEAMMVFANLSDRKKTVSWHFSPDGGHALRDRVSVEPLSITVVRKPMP